jgi:hypothetical protein
MFESNYVSLMRLCSSCATNIILIDKNKHTLEMHFLSQDKFDTINSDVMLCSVKKIYSGIY